MASFLIQLINVTVTVLLWLVIIKVILSYFMDPFHPVRENIDRIVEPLLAPFRRIMPSMGGLDFSPIIFLILLQVVGRLLAQIIFLIF